MSSTVLKSGCQDLVNLSFLVGRRLFSDVDLDLSRLVVLLSVNLWPSSLLLAVFFLLAGLLRTLAVLALRLSGASFVFAASRRWLLLGAAIFFSVLAIDAIELCCFVPQDLGKLAVEKM
jgi:hypothetical protein